MLIACILGVVPALFLLKAALILTHDRHVRRGVVIHTGTEARWVAAGLVAWAMAFPAYAWFEGRRLAPDRRTRRPLVVPLMIFVVLIAAGLACRYVAWTERHARYAREREQLMNEMSPQSREEVSRFLEGRD